MGKGRQWLMAKGKVKMVKGEVRSGSATGLMMGGW